MRLLIAMFALIAGCRTSNQPNPCEHLNTLCDAGFDSHDLGECTAKLPEVMGDNWSSFVSCSAKAGTCVELLACTSGALDERGRRLLSEFARGRRSEGTRPDGDSPLPRECARANEVCADDEPFARDKCARMVGNLKADPQNKAKLVACYADAKNCFAFQRCTDQTWVDLH